VRGRILTFSEALQAALNFVGEFPLGYTHLQNCWDIAVFFGHIHTLPFLRTNFNVYFCQFPFPLFQCCSMTFQFIPKSTTLNATMFRGKRGFGENMKHGFRAFKIWMSQLILQMSVAWLALCGFVRPSQYTSLYLCHLLLRFFQKLACGQIQVSWEYRTRNRQELNKTSGLKISK